MKKTVTMTIDENLWKKAKKQVPNISEFVEECLKYYLGLRDGLVPTLNIKETVDNISRLQAELFILNESNKVHENIRKIEDEKINRPFRALWNDYKRKLTINQELMQNVLNVIDIDAETLEDILDFTYVNREDLSINFTWEEVYEKYQQED